MQLLILGMHILYCTFVGLVGLAISSTISSTNLCIFVVVCFKQDLNLPFNTRHKWNAVDVVISSVGRKQPEDP